MKEIRKRQAISLSACFFLAQSANHLPKASLSIPTPYIPLRSQSLAAAAAALPPFSPHRSTPLAGQCQSPPTTISSTASILHFTLVVVSLISPGTTSIDTAATQMARQVPWPLHLRHSPSLPPLVTFPSLNILQAMLPCTLFSALPPARQHSHRMGLFYSVESK